MDRIVDDYHSVSCRQLSEQHPRGLSPGSVEGVNGGVVAEHENVEFADVDPLLLTLGPLDVLQEAGQGAIGLGGGAAGVAGHRSAGVMGQVGHADEPHLMLAVVGGHGQAGRRVLGVFGGDVVDDESELHALAPVIWKMFAPAPISSRRRRAVGESRKRGRSGGGVRTSRWRSSPINGTSSSPTLPMKRRSMSPPAAR